MAVYTTIDDPQADFQIKLYTGNGTNSQAQTFSGAVDMQPDMVWIKQRSGTAENALTDAVRAVDGYLCTNTSAAENSGSAHMQSLDTNGFSPGLAATMGASTETYVAWCWKAGTTSGLTGGTITPSSYSINTTNGLGMYQYTGTGSAGTIAHGLGVAPDMIFVKRTDGTANWQVQHTSLDADKVLYLNTNHAEQNEIMFNDTYPTSTVFSLGTPSESNGSGNVYMAYCFAPVKGYSNFSSYVANGNADGAFIYTGFRPALIFTKEADATSSWMVFDNKRDGYNDNNPKLSWNDSGGDTGAAADLVDILSNGFKIRSTSSEVGTSGNTYVYGAWAESPFVNSSGVPTNAR